MLTTMRSSWLLFALMALVALSTAFSVEDALNIDGINAYLHHGEKRQAQGTGGSSSAGGASSSDAPSSSNEPSPTPTPSSSAPPSSSSEVASSSDDAPSSSQSSQDRSSSDQPSPTSPPAGSSSSKSATTSAKASVSTGVELITTIIFITSDGSAIPSTSVGSRTYEVTSGASETGLPSTSGSGGGGGGLSSTNKSIIGGVVGGVGGAILLGGIAIVCWRMWGKKKRVSEDDADLMAGTGSALGDKPNSNASPFQSNLEQYHNPGGRPNAAANF